LEGGYTDKRPTSFFIIFFVRPSFHVLAGASWHLWNNSNGRFFHVGGSQDQVQCTPTSTDLGLSNLVCHAAPAGRTQPVEESGLCALVLGHHCALDATRQLEPKPKPEPHAVSRKRRVFRQQTSSDASCRDAAAAADPVSHYHLGCHPTWPLL
jgi:hypothetical protein